MPNTFFGLNISTLGIHAVNANLNVTANNIANEHTKGYSRQVARQQATRAIRVYQQYGMIGSGVEVTEIDRMRNAYYDTKYQENQTRYGQNNAKYYYMLKIEDLFNETKAPGITKQFDNFYLNAMQELSKDPSDLTVRNSYLNYCETFIEFVQEMKSELKLHQEDINSEINNNVNRVNSLSEEIASINKQINIVELTGAKANELRDKRELLLDSLAEIVEISTSEQTFANGKTEFRVKVGNDILVDNYSYYTLKVETREERVNDEDVVGLYDIQWSFGREFDPVSEGVDGTLRGLLEVRDGYNGVQPADPDRRPVKYKGIPYYVEELNEFLDSFTKSLNDIHTKGENLDGDLATNYPLFVKNEQGDYIINPEIKENPRLLATSYKSVDGVSQNDLIKDLSETKTANVYNGGTAMEFIQSVVTDMAMDTRKVKTFTESYETMGAAIENQRLSVMGVDKDEEAMNLMKFREAYDLNSKVISVMAEIYDKLIQETGV